MTATGTSRRLRGTGLRDMAGVQSVVCSHLHFSALENEDGVRPPALERDSGERIRTCHGPAWGGHREDVQVPVGASLSDVARVTSAANLSTQDTRLEMS